MSKETDSLEIIDVQWGQSRSPHVTFSPDSSLSIRACLETIYVRCKRCFHEWPARSGSLPGHFEEAVGLVNLYCPSCGQDNIIPRWLLE
jgi:hypothetical protein